jgi:3-methyl-2-oxobutanoate hydroxymethyltransferase
MEEMLYHTRCVRRVLNDPLLITDLPFGTFQLGVKETLEGAILSLKEGAQGVKIEGGDRVIPQIRALVENDIPVMGHLGLTPQSVHAFGGYRRQGKNLKNRNQIFEQAQRLEEAGVFALVLECIPEELARAIRDALRIPVIGIGSGAECDGQIVVFHDIVGLTSRIPSFVHPFASLREEATKALSEYAQMVRERAYPPCRSSPG